MGSDEVSVRYRTLAHDVQHVWLAQKDGASAEMSIASEGPLFAYWEVRVPVPASTNPRSPDMRSIDYAFVLDDGAGRVSDPYSYHYTLPPTRLAKTPEWARHAIWYQVMLDRFRNGDPSSDHDPVRP